MSSDAAFSLVAERLEECSFRITQSVKRLAFVTDRCILDTQLRPSLIVAITILLTLSAVGAIFLLRQLLSISHHSILFLLLHSWFAEFTEMFFSWVRSLSFTQHLVTKEKEKLIGHLNKQKRQFLQDERPITVLPEDGWSSQTVLSHLSERYKRNVNVSQRESKVSGTVYLSGIELEHLLCEVYRLHSYTNPLHPDVFPSVRQMEAEVVSICGNLMNPGNKARGVCGAMTGGGTESILSAVKASRDYMKAVRGIVQPEMIIAQSAHASYCKAAEYFNIKLVVLKVDTNYQMPIKELRRKIGPNTILIVASAPGFPHGIIDRVQQMSNLAQEMGVLLHVDCCLGGFFLPFAQKLGVDVPPFDFSLKGVTSISIDTHKYGMAHKGTSVVLYRSPQLRCYQYTAISDWSGGMYISPGLAGSRSGALIATAWASLMHIGEKGYLDCTDRILASIEEFKKKLSYIPELKVVGNPIGSVVAIAFEQKSEKIYQLNDVMTEKGWHLTPLQFPPAVHMSFTARHVGVIDRLIQDLKVAVEAIKNTGPSKNGTAAIYGTACSIPDRHLVKDLLKAYQDAMLSP